MTALVITSAVVLLTLIGTMTVLYYRTASELEKTRRLLKQTQKRLTYAEQTNDSIWKALMAKDGAEELHFGEF